MQEIKKRRIVIASVLKPVDDTRMFEKLGQTLAAHHDVHIIGFHVDNIPFYPGITFHSMGRFSRVSFSRLKKSWILFSKIRQLKPDITIICTHELLWPALAAKLFHPFKLWYDVQENYVRNILHTDAFSPILRPILATWVRLKELLSAPFVDRFLLAEKVYFDEMKFLRGRAVIFENKVRLHPMPSKRTTASRGLSLLFSGTLNKSTGIYDAIELASSLHALDEEVRLTIVGFCSLHSDYEKIRSIVMASDFMTLIGGNTLVPHTIILKHISENDFGIISYPFNRATQARIPTKLYEYIGLRLPILLVDNPTWVNLAAPFHAAVVYNPTAPDVRGLLLQMKEKNFYPSEPRGVYWDELAPLLLNLVK